MKWLILSNNKPELKTISETIKNLDSQTQVLTYTFSKSDFNKWSNNIFDITDVIVLTDNKDFENPETCAMLFSLEGYCTASKIPLATNSSFLMDFTAGPRDNIKVYKNTKDFIENLEKYYSILSNLAAKYTAEKTLLNRGIPFTSDCFAEYISKGLFNICQLFLSAGMNINTRDKDGTPMLNIAVRTDNEEIVSWLVEHGAEVNTESQDRGYTPVMDAVWRGNKKITEYLIKKGAELNTICKEGQSNLVLAVGADKIDIVKLLAEHGADPDIKDAMGMSAWDYAKLFKKEKIISILEPFHKES
ncbi:MAG: ankyrin repeat domain-containing protein [Treponema sp.]|nr:ankyrin repeat domain-containing protein [Treponema sp.]